MPRGVSKVSASKTKKPAVPATQKPAAKSGRSRKPSTADSGAQVAVFDTSARLKARLNAALHAVESAYKPSASAPSRRNRTALPDFATLQALKAARTKADSELHNAKAAMLQGLLKVLAVTRTTGKKAGEARKKQCGSGRVCLVPSVDYPVKGDGPTLMDAIAQRALKGAAPRQNDPTICQCGNVRQFCKEGKCLELFCMQCTDKEGSQQLALCHTCDRCDADSDLDSCKCGPYCLQHTDGNLNICHRCETAHCRDDNVHYCESCSETFCGECLNRKGYCEDCVEGLYDDMGKYGICHSPDDFDDHCDMF